MLQRDLLESIADIKTADTSNFFVCLVDHINCSYIPRSADIKFLFWGLVL